MLALRCSVSGRLHASGVLFIAYIKSLFRVKHSYLPPFSAQTVGICCNKPHQEVAAKMEVVYCSLLVWLLDFNVDGGVCRNELKLLLWSLDVLAQKHNFRI